MKKVSLVTPLKNEVPLLDRGLKELEAFIQRFPLEWELVVALDPAPGRGWWRASTSATDGGSTSGLDLESAGGSTSAANLVAISKKSKVDETLLKARALKSEKIEVKVVHSSSRKGRGPSLKAGLEAATGDYVMIFPMDFTIPLAEMFNFLQELVVNPEIDLVIGNRNSSRKKHEAPARTSWHWTLEKIIKDKLKLAPESAQWSFQDPLCPYLIFQRSSLQKILPSLQMKSWYYTPEILRAASSLGMKIVEAPILSRDTKSSRIPLWQEYIRNLF